MSPKQSEQPPSTGVDDLDEDHLLILDVMRVLRQAVEDRQKEMARVAAEALVELSRNHFRRELSLMAASAFPLTQDHDVAHRFFLDGLDRMRLNVDRGLWLPTAVELRKAGSMLAQRLLVDDVKYGEWVARKNWRPRFSEGQLAALEKADG